MPTESSVWFPSGRTPRTSIVKSTIATTTRDIPGAVLPRLRARPDPNLSREPQSEGAKMEVVRRRMRAAAHIGPRRGGNVAPGTRRRFLVFAFLCSAPWAAQSGVLPDSDYAALVKAVIDQVVVPACIGHARAMRRLGPVIEQHCMGDSATDTSSVRAAFDEAMDAWQRVSPFGLGPVMRGAGRARIAFWPGRPSSAARQMRTVLRKRDESLLDPGQLAGKSVAIKDLQALERLLFDVPRDAYTCGLAGAIARYQSNLAEDILHEWTKEGGFRQAALAAGAASDEYADDAEVARDVMRVLSESLDAVIAQKLEAPLGESAAKAKPKRAESWRSERSMRNIVLNIESIRALVETSGGFADLVTAHGESELADDLRKGLADAASKARAVALPLRDAVSDPGARANLLALVGSLRALRTLVTGPLSRTTGLLIGFNSQDGD